MALIGDVHICLFLIIIGYGQAWDYSGYYNYEQHEVCYFEEYAGFAVYGRNELTIPDADLEVCKKTCQHTTDFDCKSFDYNTRTRACFLSSANRHSSTFGEHVNSVHYEKECDISYDNPDDDPNNVDFPGKLVYEDGHCFVKFGPIRDPNKQESDQVLAFQGNITKVKVIYSTAEDHPVIYSVLFTYGNTPAFVPDELPGIETSEMETSLEADEYILSIHGAYGAYSYLSMVQLTTNRRVLGPYGDASRAAFQFQVDSPNKRLAYITYARTNNGFELTNCYFYC